jgi:FKBP-type peptidyl-prolyl cis-trans isomerase
MAKENATKVGMFVIALLFVATSVGSIYLLVWQQNDNQKRADAARVEQQAAAETQAKQQQEEATKALDQENKLADFTPTSTPQAELTKIDTVVGTGEEVKPGATVTVNYTGAFMSNGVVFDSSIPRGEPITFPLSGVIKGWTDGVPGMKVGGKRRLLIPYAQAYGETGSRSIPGKADLVFDIELIGIK